MKADQAGLRRAIGFYERAVALDSTFAQAWSQLSRARTSLYSNGVPGPGAGRRGADGGRAGASAQARRSAGLSGRRRFLRQRQPDRQRAGRGRVRAGAPPRARRRGPAERGWRWPRRGWGAGTASPARLARASRLDPALDHGGAPAGGRAHLPPAATPPPTRRPTGRSRSRRPTRRWCCSR